MITVLVVADYHGSYAAVERTVEKAMEEKAEVIVVCGDITHFGNIASAKKSLQTLTKSRLPILFLPGNCDPTELAEDVKIEGVYNLHGRHLRIGNIDFIGIGGGNPGPFDMPFQLSEEDMATLLEKAHQNVRESQPFVLISHTPPRNTKLDITYTGLHVGSVAIRNFIERTKPSLVICGHIHEARGVDAINSVQLINPGPAKLGLCAVVTINKKIKTRLSML